MANLSGKELGNYRIIERIGRGGMAEVYRGVHKNLDRQVAIKVMLGHLSEGEEFRARFEREAKAVASLRHPNIVQVYDFDIQDEIIFMVMEYIEGTNLHKRMAELARQGKRLSTAQIGSIINDVAQALDYAHSKGMLHRDVKPSNILLDSDDKAYLTDFGIARILTDPKFTATGTMVGTPAYMSPEQGSGKELTKESDIYSLGVVAFEMLTGQVPYDGQTPIAIVYKQMSEPIPDITKLVDDVPDSTQAVIDTVLAKSPDRRYPSGEALVTALHGALNALISSDPSLRQASPLAPEGGEEAFSAQTAKIQHASEVHRATVPAEEGERLYEAESEGTVAVSREPSPSAKSEPKRKIPVWGFGIGGVVLLGIVGIVLSQVIGFGQPQTEPAEPGGTEVAPDVPEPAATDDDTLFDDFEDPAFEGRFNPELWYVDDRCDIVQQDGALSMIWEPSYVGNGCGLFAKPDLLPPLGSELGSGEVRMQMSSERSDEFVGADFGLEVIFPEGAWKAGCGFHGYSKSEIAIAFSINDNRLYIDERLVYWQSFNVIELDRWYTMRLEVDPDTMAFSCFLDGEKIGSYIPENATELKEARFEGYSIWYWREDSQTYGTILLDDFRFTQP